MLFIVIHQVYELWFKELLHELDRVRAAAHRRRAAPRPAHAEADPDDPQGAGRAARHPRDDDAARVPVVPRAARSGQRIPVGPVPADRVRARRQERQGHRAVPRRQPRARARSSADTREPTLWDAFLHYLAREGYPVPAAHLTRDTSQRRRAVGRDPGHPDRRLPQRREERRALRAARRSRRRHPGVALSPRQDGGADDRHEAGHRRIERRRISHSHARAEPVFPDLWEIRGQTVERAPVSGLPVSGLRSLVSGLRATGSAASALIAGAVLADAPGEVAYEQGSHKLRVFGDAHRLTIAVYRATSAFPRDEQFGMRLQIRQRRRIRSEQHR